MKIKNIPYCHGGGVLMVMNLQVPCLEQITKILLPNGGLLVIYPW